MVDLLPYFTIGGIMVAIIVGMFQIKESLKKRGEEHQKAVTDQITQRTDNIISHIDDKLRIIDQKFNTTETALSNNTDDITDIEQDVHRLEEDFKSLCFKIGKHDYIVEKILPEYMDLKSSISNFKTKIDENLLTNKDNITRNTDDDTGQEGLK